MCVSRERVLTLPDQLEYMSLKDGEAYNESLKPFCRGDKLPNRTIPVEWMMYDLWEEMRGYDRELAVRDRAPDRRPVADCGVSSVPH